MITLILIFLAIPALIFVGLLLLKIRSKKLLMGIPIAILCLPLVLGFGIYLARTPIQQGKFLAEVGPLLNSIFPPDDLYKTLAEENLSPTKATYIFNISHKYVGNHGIFIIVPSDRPSIKYRKSLGVSTRFFIGNKLIFEKPNDNHAGQYWGIDTYGFFFSNYNVPRDLPVSEPLTVEVTIHGDIDAFLKENLAAKVAVKKMSDE